MWPLLSGRYLTLSHPEKSRLSVPCPSDDPSGLAMMVGEMASSLIFSGMVSDSAFVLEDDLSRGSSLFVTTIMGQHILRMTTEAERSKAKEERLPLLYCRMAMMIRLARFLAAPY